RCAAARSRLSGCMPIRSRVMSHSAGTANRECCPLVGQGVEFRLLGPFEVRVDGRVMDVGSPKHRILLAALLLQPGRPVPVEDLAEAIWGGAHLPGNSRRAVQLYVARLRGQLARPGAREVITTCPVASQAPVRPTNTTLCT